MVQLVSMFLTDPVDDIRLSATEQSAGFHNHPGAGASFVHILQCNSASCNSVVHHCCAVQSFKTVSAAIGSHPGHMEVTLEFQRC
jgi:hypothetical protein